MESRKLDLSFVIPALDEGENIVRVVSGALAEAGRLGLSCELLVMDGGSKDATAEAASSAGARVVVEKGGFAESLRRGFRESRGEWILVMDGDGSHPAEHIPVLWSRRLEADIIVGSRFVQGGQAEMPGWRDAMSRALNSFFRGVMGTTVSDSSSGYRLYRAAAVRGLEGKSRSFEFQQETLLNVLGRGGKALEVPIRYIWRENGVSKARLSQLLPGYAATVWRFFGRRR